jgi:hypothetical protein
MKKFLRILLVAMALVTFCVGTYAQKENRKQMTREHLAEMQAKYIAKETGMDDATSKKFIVTFCQFQKEIWSLGPRPKKDSTDSSDAESEQAIKERFVHSQKILDLRKTYYVEYSKFLTQKQIANVYKLEREMMMRLYHRSQKNDSIKK